MNKEECIEILESWNFWKKDRETGIYRKEYVERLEKLMRTQQVVVIDGVRRSGKSTIIKQYIKKQIEQGKKRENFLYINFEEPKFSGMLSLDFLQQLHDAYIEIVHPKGQYCIMLDEIQNIPQWEKFVRSIHEKREAEVIISGSSSKLLSKELGTLLTGRWVELKVYPLRFSEFLLFKNIHLENKLDILSQKHLIRQHLREYIEYGGFPLVVLQEEKKELLLRYFEDVLGKDIAERYNIRIVEKLRILAKWYLTVFASPNSYRKIAKTIGISIDTVERFSSYMSDAYLIFFVSKFSYSLKEQEVNPKKVYCIDLGLINIMSLRFSENIGRLYEALVYLSLLQKGKEIYYYKEKSECDFVIKEGTIITQAIQVCYSLDNKDTQKREIQGLLEASKELKCKNLVIITDSIEKEEKINNKTIVYIPLWKWLLS